MVSQSANMQAGCSFQLSNNEVHIWTMPSEIENAVPFEQDRAHAQYDREYVSRFRQTIVQSTRVMNEFRARFIGKASPVHFFWGSFDLAVSRFSGRTAPPPKSVTPNVAAWVMAEAIWSAWLVSISAPRYWVSRVIKSLKLYPIAGRG